MDTRRRFPCQAATVALLLALSSPAWSCDPAAFDFDTFLNDHDRNRDGFLQRAELLASDPSGDRYGNTLDRPVNTAGAFTELDRNRDARLSAEELWEWGVHTHDPCAGWPARAQERGLFERFLAVLRSFFE